MEETNKRINPIVIIILIVGIYMTISVISKKFGIKEKANVEKTLYIPVDITKKYPKDFAEEKVAIKEIKNSIKDKKSQIIDNKEVETYYDSKGRIVYTIKAELEAIVSAQGGKGGYYYKRFYPEENGVIYDKSGHIIKKLETSSSYNTGFYEVASKEDSLRKSYLNNGKTNGVIKIINIS